MKQIKHKYDLKIYNGRIKVYVDGYVISRLTKLTSWDTIFLKMIQTYLVARYTYSGRKRAQVKWTYISNQSKLGLI